MNQGGGSVQIDRGGLFKQTEGVCSNGQTNIEPYIEPYIDKREQDKILRPAPSFENDSEIEGDADIPSVNTKNQKMTPQEYAEQHAKRKLGFQKKESVVCSIHAKLF